MPLSKEHMRKDTYLLFIFLLVVFCHNYSHHCHHFYHSQRLNYLLRCCWIIFNHKHWKTWLTLSLDCLLDQVQILQDLSTQFFRQQCAWDGTWRGRFRLHRASCCCNCWSCFGKPSGDSRWQIDSLLGLISTFFPLCPYAAFKQYKTKLKKLLKICLPWISEMVGSE